MAVLMSHTQVTTEEAQDIGTQPFSGKRFAYEKSRPFTHAREFAHRFSIRP
jgi:hypothetical protein